jgi:murein L,D-transpeptidase YcbB/YkuD
VRIRLLLRIAALWIASAAATACGPVADTSRVTSETVPTATVLGRSDIAVPARGRFVLVNIPSFELVALEDGREILRSRVIVGAPATPTPELLSSLYAVRFNPSWTPTPAMVRREGARPVPPGPRNPLGRILFQLDNEDLIYLHDTNDRSLFDRAERALSHGCIRVQRARALAAWALRTPDSEVTRMIAAGTTRSVPLSRPIPVMLAYHTRFPDENGDMKTHPDIYGRMQAADPHNRTDEQAVPAGCRPAV